MSHRKNKIKQEEQSSKPKANILAWIAIGISLISLFISGTQYIRTQRPKITTHPDTRLLSKTEINNKEEEYRFGFVFQNTGEIECAELDLNIIIMTENRKIVNRSKHTSNAIFPGALFNTILSFKLPRSEISESQDKVPVIPEDLLFYVTVEYPAFPFGRHKQKFYYVFHQDKQKMYHCDIANVSKIDEILAKD